MPKHTRRFDPEQITLAVFVSSAIGAFALSYRAQPAWLLLLLCLASLIWRVRDVPPWLRVSASYVAWAIIFGTVVLGLIFMAYPILSAQTAARLSLLAGYSLALFSALFLLGARVWSPASNLFPAALGTLVVGALNTNTFLYAALAVAGWGVFAYLSLGTRSGQAAAGPAVRVWRPRIRLIFSALGIVAVAWAIILFLPWAQNKVEQATFLLYSSQSIQYSSLSLHARLGDLEQLKLSPKIVMRVWTSRPQKLRGRVFTRFDGQSWHARELPAQSLPQVAAGTALSRNLAEWFDTLPGNLFVVPGYDPKQPEGAETIRSMIVQEVFNNGMLVSPGEKVLVRAPVSYLSMDPYGGLAPPLSSPVEIYGVANRRHEDIVQGGDASPSIIAECLALPSDTDRRLEELAARLARGASGTREQITRTVTFLQSGFHYSLNVGRFHSRQPVAEFLFEKKKGYCEYFASAAAVLLRLQGVPCRYVTGFNVQEGNQQAGHYLVREADAHAWIEAYVPGTGWVEADPTPEEEYQALHANLGSDWLEAAIEWSKAELAEILIRFRQGDWLAALRWIGGQLKLLLRSAFVNWIGSALALLVLTALAASLVVWVKRPRSAGLAGKARIEALDPGLAEVAELMARLDDALARTGFLRPPARAPLEHWANIPPEKISPELRAVSRQIVDCFYRACFGGDRPAPTVIQDLRRSISQADQGSSLH